WEQNSFWIKWLNSLRSIRRKRYTCMSTDLSIRRVIPSGLRLILYMRPFIHLATRAAIYMPNYGIRRTRCWLAYGSEWIRRGYIADTSRYRMTWQKAVMGCALIAGTCYRRERDIFSVGQLISRLRPGKSWRWKAVRRWGGTDRRP